MKLGNLFKATLKIAVSPVTLPVALAQDVMASMVNEPTNHTKKTVDSIAHDLNEFTKKNGE